MRMVKLFWYFLKQTRNPVSAYIFARIHTDMEDMAKAFAELSPEDKEHIIKFADGREIKSPKGY